MNRMTFVGRTAREAMQAARMRFGPDIEIVGSRQVPNGVELTAQVASLRGVAQRGTAVAVPRKAVVPSALQHASAERPMSTVSFEEFVRSRQEATLASSRAEPGRARRPDPVANAGRSVAARPAEARPAEVRPDDVRPDDVQPDDVQPVDAQLVEAQPDQVRHAQTRRAAQALRPAVERPDIGGAGPSVALTPPVQPSSVPRTAEGAIESHVLMQELQSIKRFIAGQLETVRWFDTTRRRPAQLRLLRQLLARGFSPMLGRSLCDLLPIDFDDEEADRWLQQTLVRTLAGFGSAGGDAPDTLFDAGGVFAFTGPTGVGKTTSIAKIAARYALTNGAAGVALITADVYRIGAQDQLRSFGRLLGVPVHVAHDRAALTDLLGLFGDRRLVLIDTAGVGQRDERVGQLLSALELDPIQRIVVLNAAMQAATLHDVIAGYRAQAARAVLVSKTDEAVQLGPIVDALVRHRLALAGVCDGQRVPEDFRCTDLSALVSTALEGPPDEDPQDELAAGELRLVLEGGHV